MLREEAPRSMKVAIFKRPPLLASFHGEVTGQLATLDITKWDGYVFHVNLNPCP